MVQRALERRAVEAAIWAVPAVNFERLYDGLTSAKGDWNQIVYWSRLPDWKNQTLTPNPDVIYLMPFYDTRNGPVVLEIPAADGGSITWSGWCRQGQGWQVPHPASGLQGEATRRLHSDAIANLLGLRAPAIQHRQR
jgi:hypothetical protein